MINLFDPFFISVFRMKTLIGLVILLVSFSLYTHGFNVYCKSEYFRQKVEKTGCDTDYVGVYACLGTCGSYVLPLSNPPFFRKVSIYLAMSQGNICHRGGVRRSTALPNFQL